jgi:hypothetical protein
MTKWIRVIATVSTLSLGGCVADGAGPDTKVTDDPQQKTSGYWIYEWDRPTNLPEDDNYHSMGSPSNKTCFLAGLTGTMVSGDEGTVGTELYTSAYAGVLDDGWGAAADYDIVAYPGVSGEKLGARAVCAATTAGQSDVYYYDATEGGPAVKMAPTDSPLTICGLTAVAQPTFNFDPTGNLDFNAIGDELHIFASDGYWYLGGAGNAAGYAQCIQVSARSDEWTVNNSSVDLSSGAGRECFLTGLKGIWQTSDFGNGVWIDYDADLLQWTLTGTGGGYKRAWARCMR